MLLYAKIIQLLLVYRLQPALVLSSSALSSSERWTPKLTKTASDAAAGEDEAGTLRQVLLVHRHGDRTPISFPQADPLRHEPLWSLYGQGQLTREGKLRVYRMGQQVRKRYEHLMLRSVNKNWRFSRTAQVPRCVESAQLFLAAFLALDLANATDGGELAWQNEGLGRHWQPVSVASAPQSFDGMLAASAKCPALQEEMDQIYQSKATRDLFADYRPEIETLERVYGVQIADPYQLTDIIDTVLIEAHHFGGKLAPEVAALVGRLVEANNKAFGLIQSTTKARRLRAGLLMNELVHQMDARRHKNRSNHNHNKFLHYSSQDTMVTVLLGMLDAWQNRQPGFASNLALELHQDHHQDQEEWFVRAFYQSEAPSGERQELELAGCKRLTTNRCTLDNFRLWQEPYLFASGWQQWMGECGNRLDKLNPYA